MELPVIRKTVRYPIVRHGLKRAKKCIKCGKCEEACPQHIVIRDNLVKVSEALIK